MGDAVAIIIGQLLGAGKMEEARDTDNKIIVFSVACCIGVAVLMAHHTNTLSNRNVTIVFPPERSVK